MTPPLRAPQRQGQAATPGQAPRRVRETPHPSAARLLYGRVCKCRKRSNAGGAGGEAPGKIILESPPSQPGKGGGGMGGKKESKRQGRQATRKASPPRHLLSLPRGRGPSQTPKFLSPGPPSPWLPALPPRKQTETFGRAGAARVQPRGCKGLRPLHEITLNLPLPRRGRGQGG